MRAIFPVIILLLLVSCTPATFYTTCVQSLTRTCLYGTNITDRLLNLKKGGSNLPATNTYDPNFYICEEYGYNCGYLQQQNDFLTIAQGMQLNMTYSQLLQIIPSDSTLTNLIKPYLNSSGSSAQCLNNFFPLILTDTQSNTAMNGFLSRLSSNLSAIYASKKATTSPSWSTLNINIITPILQMAKINMNINFVGSTLWSNLLAANYTAMADELRSTYESTNTPVYLRSAYLIDSVTKGCDKYQSINFLVDQSAAVSSTNFNYVKTFLTNYVSQTQDDLGLMSIHYYDSTFESSIGYGNSKSAILSAISSKTCRSSGNANLGNAINNTLAKINAAGYSSGLPKILVILVGSTSLDNVYYASEYGRALGVTIIAVGIGSGYNNTQLLQAAYTQSNLIYVSSYPSITTLHSQLPNLLAHQYIDIALNSTLSGGVVRSASYPNYYRLPRDSTGKNYYYMTITFGSDPNLKPFEVLQSHYDPFPDKYSDCNCSQIYRTSIYNFEYYIAPVTGWTVAIKKDQTAIKFLYYTYFNIAGNNLTYNITVKNCSTNNCTEEIAAAKKIGSMNVDNFNGNGNSNNNGANSLTQNDVPSNVWDPSIFMEIGGGILGLAIGTYATISGLRQFRQSPDQPSAQVQDHMDTNQDLEANNEDQLVQQQNQNNLRGSHKRHNHQRHNHRRHNHQRSEHRSNRPHSRDNKKKQENKKSSWDDDSQCYVQDKHKADNNKSQHLSNKSQRQSRKSNRRSVQRKQNKKQKEHNKSEKHNSKQKQKKKEKTPQKPKSKKATPEKHNEKKKGTPEKLSQKRKATPQNKGHKK